MAATHASDR